MRSLAPLLLAVGLMAGLTACGRGEPVGVLILTVDGLRPDALGPETPELQAIARGAVVFDDALTPAPLSLPAHASLLTGLDPRRHGAREDRAAPLSAEATTLAERLAELGWATGATLAGSELGRGSGLEQGFERFDAPPPPDARIRLGPAELRADVAVTRALEAIDALAATGRPFLHVLQLVDPRPPLDPPGALEDDPPARRHALAVAFADAEIGRLVEGLSDRDLWDDLIVVVCAPRGLALGDARAAIGEDLGEDALRVPLWIRAPALDAARVAGTASLVDVAPTVLALLGLPLPDDLDGRSLYADDAPAVPPGRALAIECRHSLEGHGAAPWVGVVRDELKLVRGARVSMHDRRADPLGERELFRPRDARSEGMRAELERRFGVLGPEDAARFDPAELGPRLERLALVEQDLLSGRTSEAQEILRAIGEEAPEDAVAASLAAGILLAIETPGAARLVEVEPLLERLLAARPDDPFVLELDARYADASVSLLRREVMSAEFRDDAAVAADGKERVKALRLRQIDALRRALAREPDNAALARKLEIAEIGLQPPVPVR